MQLFGQNGRISSNVFTRTSLQACLMCSHRHGCITVSAEARLRGSCLAGVVRGFKRSAERAASLVPVLDEGLSVPGSLTFLESCLLDDALESCLLGDALRRRAVEGVCCRASGIKDGPSPGSAGETGVSASEACIGRSLRASCCRDIGLLTASRGEVALGRLP